MKHPFIYKHYTLNAPAGTIGARIADLLEENDYREIASADGVTTYRYPGFTFNSKRPLSCVSRMTVRVDPDGNGSRVHIGMTFTKIRYFTITLISLICLIIPATLGYMQHGYPDIPPMSFLGIPLGFMLHYHVRWRVYTALKRLIMNAEYLEQEKR